MKKFVLVLISSATLVGCSVPSLNFSPDESLITVATNTNRINAELRSITVSLAKDNERTGDIEVGVAGNSYEASFQIAYKAALEDSIVRSGIFKDDANKKYSLLAKILKMDTRSWILDSFMEVEYKIIDRETNEPVYTRRISSEGKDNTLFGASRATKSRNNAVQNNIKLFIDDLYKANLK